MVRLSSFVQPKRSARNLPVAQLTVENDINDSKSYNKAMSLRSNSQIEYDNSLLAASSTLMTKGQQQKLAKRETDVLDRVKQLLTNAFNVVTSSENIHLEEQNKILNMQLEVVTALIEDGSDLHAKTIEILKETEALLTKKIKLIPEMIVVEKNYTSTLPQTTKKEILEEQKLAEVKT